MEQNEAFSGDFVKMDGTHSKVYERPKSCRCGCHQGKVKHVGPCRCQLPHKKPNTKS